MNRESFVRRGESKVRRGMGLFVVVALGLSAVSMLFASPVAAITVMVPYSAVPVSDAQLDGDPATGDWSGSVSAAVPLENGEAGSYGTATLYAKHDGTTVYFRLDGQIDVPWASATGNRFWLGMEWSTGTGGHHSGGSWDGVYFGLWDGADYTPQPTYPPPAVDTTGFARPPPKDGTQSFLGFMRYSGSAAPYGYTAEWKRALSTGDTQDITFTADGTTAYSFYVTTDSDGRGSSGGAIDHSANTNPNTMRFDVTPPPPNTPPTVDLTSPNGGEVWTGGPSHRIWWNMSDAQTATSSLRVWINYSTDGGASYAPIPAAQGVSGFSNPCSFSWTVPAVDTTRARVRVAVADGGGLTATDASLADFTIDSTSPLVTTFNPADGATGVNPSTQVRVTFSETMNESSAQQAFSLMRVDNGAYFAGSFSWVGNELRFAPASSLAQGVVFRAQVNGSARDASIPGNTLGTVRTASFTTADLTPPSITGVNATPSPQEIGLTVNVSATISDNGLVTGVWILVRDPGGSSLGNDSAAYDPGFGRHYRTKAYNRPGAHTFQVTAQDAAGNFAVSSGGFTMVDTQPPTIVHTPVTQAVRGVAIRIAANVGDVDAVADVRVDYVDVLGTPFNVSLALNGSTDEYDVPGQPQLGTLDYFVWAVDPTGNAARTVTHTVQIVDSDTTPPVVASVAAVPPIQNATFSVNVTASVTDNVAVLSTSVVVTDPTSTVLGNFTMARFGATDTFYFSRSYAVLGTYQLLVWALDTTGNAASATGSFEIVDLLPPVFQWVSALPSPQESGLPVNLAAAVTDNVGVDSVSARILDPLGGVAYDGPMAGTPEFPTLSVTYVALGTYAFTLTAEDALGNAATDGGSFDIVDTQPPVAVAGPDQVVGRGTLVTFDGSASHDNTGIANHTWSLFDGGAVELYGAVTSRVFANEGTFLVTLTVMDLAGNTGTDTLWVNVTADSAPPTADAGDGQTIPQGSTATLDGSESTDDTGIANYSWSFDDGGPVVLWGAVVQYRFLNAGNFTIVLTVVDLVGKSASDSTWVDVIPDTNPPIARAGPDQTIDLGQMVTLDGSASSDDTGIVNFTWQVVANGQLLYGASVTFTPNAAGTWRFVLTVRDAAGLTGSDDVNVTVVAPQVPDTTPPEKPEELQAETHGPGAILVSWSENEESDLAGYALFRSDSEDGPFVRLNGALLQDTTYVDQGLEPGRRYWYVVRAVDTSGNISEPSDRDDASAGLFPPASFDLASLRWVVFPLIAGVLLALLALLAWRSGRRKEPEVPPPPAEAHDEGGPGGPA